MPICIERGCDKEFEISEGEREFFNAKGFELPKRCKGCRGRRKAANAPLAGGRHHQDGGEHQQGEME